MQITQDEPRPPVRTPETDEFWNAANDGKLHYGFCRDCATPHYYPRRVCPFCMSEHVEWPVANGTGKIYAFSPARKGHPPYVLAWVTLDEGVSLITNITDCHSDMLSIGMSVSIVFRPAPDGQMVPLFRPVQR